MCLLRLPTCPCSVSPLQPALSPPNPSLPVPAPCQAQSLTQAPAPAAWPQAQDYPAADPAHLPGQVDKVRGEGGAWRGALERTPRPSPPPAQPLPAEDVPAEGDDAPGSGCPQFQGNNRYVGNAKVTSWDRAGHQRGTRPPGGPYIKALMPDSWVPRVAVCCCSKVGFSLGSPSPGSKLGGLRAVPIPVADKVLCGQPEEAELQPELRERLAALLLRQPRHQPTKSLLWLLAELGLSPCRGRHGARPWVATWLSHRASLRCHQPGAIPMLAVRLHTYFAACSLSLQVRPKAGLSPEPSSLKRLLRSR